MVIVNPTTSDITVQIAGIRYTVEAGKELRGIPAEHALYWKQKLHPFIVVKEESKEVKTVKSEEVGASIDKPKTKTK